MIRTQPLSGLKIFLLYLYIKVQLISEANCQAVNYSKKRTNEFDFTTMIPQVDLFSFVLEEIEDISKSTDL